MEHVWQFGDVILDRYEVKQVFTGGGMGLVYRVHHRDSRAARRRMSAFATAAGNAPRQGAGGSEKLEVLPQPSDPGAGSPNATPLEAFKALRAMGGLRHIIPDPVAWQREQRADRSLPGRD